MGDIPQIALHAWTLGMHRETLLGNFRHRARFTPFLSMHKHMEVFVSIKAQDKRYCKYMFAWEPGALFEVCKKSCTASKDLILQEHYSCLTREGTDLYTA